MSRDKDASNTVGEKIIERVFYKMKKSFVLTLITIMILSMSSVVSAENQSAQSSDYFIISHSNKEFHPAIQANKLNADSADLAKNQR